MDQNNKPVPGLAARQSALRLLDAVCRRGETLDQTMASATGKLANPSDKALAHNIAANVLRWMGALDDMIDSATRNRLADDAKARMTLRIALVQVLVLDTPQHAAIATALPLVHGGPRRLVHGVFSTVMRGVAAGEHGLPTLPELPIETQERWAQSWDENIAEAASRAWAAPAPLDLSFKTSDYTGIEGQSLASKHLRTSTDLAVTALPGFAEGNFWVQDLAATIPARLLGDGQGRTVFDLCAAPGGKTMQLASAGWDVVSVDNNARRMERFHDNLNRTGLKAEAVIADLMKWAPAEPADAVLLDAPCSATGIYRRHPDVLHCIGPRQIAERAELQAALLKRSAKWVKPGGQLVYAVCSLEPEEGEAQIEKFLADHAEFTILSVAQDELPDGVAPSPDGTVRTLPDTLADRGHVDGFYIARMQRAN